VERQQHGGTRRQVAFVSIARLLSRDFHKFGFDSENVALPSNLTVDLKCFPPARLKPFRLAQQLEQLLNYQRKDCRCDACQKTKYPSMRLAMENSRLATTARIIITENMSAVSSVPLD
jgi:hypothetical protein